jgi:tetratricopeptide (TPR) repeat protein
MSLHQKARELIDQAQTAIQAGDPQYAMELLRQSIMYNGKDAEAYILLGITLAHLKMPADAENSLKKAVRMAPENVKARYNLAVHQYTEGQPREALENARKAVELDALHANSKSLVTQIEEELAISPGQMPLTTAAGNPTPASEAEYRPGYEEEPVQTMPFVERLGPIWTSFGWAIAFISLVLGVYFLMTVIPLMTAKTGNNDQLIQSMAADPKIGLVRIFYVLTNLLGLAFVALDAVNRRGNLLWIIPQVICGCTGFTFLIVPLYLKLGRNN